MCALLSINQEVHSRSENDLCHLIFTPSSFKMNVLEHPAQAFARRLYGEQNQETEDRDARRSKLRNPKHTSLLPQYESTPNQLLEPSGQINEDTRTQRDNGRARERLNNADSKDQGVRNRKNLNHIRPSAGSESTKHEERLEEIKKILGPILNDKDNSGSVLLCWGRPDYCQILPVQLSYSAGDEASWKIIRKAWYEHRGVWRKHIPFSSVQEVSIVDVSQ
jgi:hypothetical protein